MHDLTGQSLSMITLKSELAAPAARTAAGRPDRDRAREEIEQVAEVSRQTLHDISEAISGYRRPTLAVEIITARAALEAAGITPQTTPRSRCCRARSTRTPRRRWPGACARR